MNREQFLKILKSKDFNLEDPEVIRSLYVLKCYGENFPVVQTFLAENGLEINLLLKYPCIHKSYPLKLSDSPVPVALYNTFIFKPL